MNLALEALRRARAAGYTFCVRCDEFVDYSGNNVNAAWRAVVDCDEIMTVVFFNGEAERIGWLQTTAYGLEPDENIIDYSGSGLIAVICDAVCEL